ncbi:MAG: hypothetical protein A2061_10320 [Gallionellales bacterium GWA2_59_43]|nr:MAG: hypothetical protein A2061_10320 [Gallionellales bacterium GWA2_59_43]
MLKKLSLILSTMLLVAGCATIEFTLEGQAVRTISPVVAQNCDHLGLASSWKAAGYGGLTAAQVDIRNKVGAMGGNAMVVASQQVDPPPYQHAQIMAEAYRCDFKKPQ